MKRKHIAVILTVLFAITIFFAHIFTVCEADHDCHGGDCPVCQLIQVAENFFKGITAAEIIAVFVAAVFVAAVVSAVLSKNFIFQTLVTLKIKLSD